MPPTPPALHALAGKPAAIYIRVSTDDQADYGYSLPTQLAACRAYAQQYGFTVDDRHIYQDDITGSTLHRPGLTALRDLIQQRTMKAVIILSWDRLSRKQGHQAYLIDEFEAAGVQCYETSVAPEKPNANTIFLRGVKGAMAEYERAQILERTERGRRGRATAGYPVVQKVPLGYRYEGTAHQGAYVIMPDEAAVVERIFHLYVESRLTMYGIACLLRREGVPTYGDRRVRAYPQERESRWYTTYIQRILTNTAYLGTVYYGKTTRCPSPKAPDKKSAWKVTERDTWIAVPVPPIVSQDLWDAAQRQRQHNAQMSRRNRKSDYLLGGSRLRCEVCGLVMSGTTSRTTRYYRCNQLSPAVAPHCRRLVNADWIEPAVWAEVLRLVEHPDYLRTLIAAQQEEPSILARQAERERLERDARQVAHKLRRWEDAYEDASISLGTFKMKQQPLEAQQTLLTTRLHLLTVEEERDRAWTSEWERLLAWLHGL